MMKYKEKLKSRKFLVRFIAAMAALLIFLVAAVYTVFIQPNLSQKKYIYIEETVQKGDLILGIMESGSISLEESSLDYTLQLDTEEEDEDSEDEEDDEEEEESIKYLEIEEAYVVSGQRIEEGEALFKLTDKSVEAVEKRLTTLFTEAEIALAEAETEYRIEALQAKSTYDTSMLEAEWATASYQASATKTQESMNGLAADIQVLEAEIAYYQEQLADEDLWELLEEAQTTYTSAKNQFEETDVHNATAYASNYSEYKTAEQQLELIQGQIDELNKGIEENQKSIAEKQKKMGQVQSSLEVEELTNESAYESAVLGGELAEDIYNYTVDSLEDSVTVAKTEQEEAENNLEEFKSFVGEDGIIYADGSGLVTSVSYEAGDDLITTGAMISYVKEGAYTVTIDVSEEDISAITVGDTVDIVMSAYPDATYEGTIVSITTTAASDYASTISYPVTIRIEGDTSLLYGGMTAEVTFVTDSVEDVLYVSKKAVIEKDGKNYVYTGKTSGSRKLVEVETGFSDGRNIEIISGLSEGDTVYIESKINGSEEELRKSESEENGEAGGAEGMTDMEGMFGGEGNDEMPEGMSGDDWSGEMPEGMSGGDWSGEMPEGMSGGDWEL